MFSDFDEYTLGDAEKENDTYLYGIKSGKFGTTTPKISFKGNTSIIILSYNYNAENISEIGLFWVNYRNLKTFNLLLT